MLLLLALTVPALAQETGVLTKPPEVVEFVEATFPESEGSSTASVLLEVTIGADGSVEDVVVSESAGEAFDAAAVDAVRRFVFSPAEIDGAPSRIRILYRYDFVRRAAVPTSAEFAGVVRDREEKVPVPGVTVTLGDRSVVTDEAGRFEFTDVPPGTLAVTLEGERLTALATEETLVAGERLEATYDVFLLAPDEEGDDLEILVQAPTIRREAVSTRVLADDARDIPGTQGDVVRVVENFGGVARASLGTGALIVWGAAPDDTTTYVDGVPVPRLYHDGGLRSVVGSDFVRSVELVPGGYGAVWGRGLGGLVSIETPRFDDALHGSVAADLYDASAAIHGPATDRLDLGIAGRVGYVGPLLSAFDPDVEDVFPVPHYADGQARVGLRLRPGETLDLTGLVSTDRTERTAPNDDPARESSEERRLAFQRVSLRYARDVGDGTTLSAVVFGGADQTSLVGRFGATETAIRTRSTLFGARAAWRARPARFVAVEAGVDALVQQTDVVREGSIAVPSREGDVRVFGQPPPDQVSSDDYRVVAYNLAPYVQGDVGLFDDRLHLVGGLRFDPYARSVSHAAPKSTVAPSTGLLLQDAHLEPRLAVRFAPTDASYVMAAWGLYGQQPQAADLSAAFGNPTLPAATGVHYVLGGGVSPIDPLTVDVTGFYTTSSGLAMRNASEQPARAEALVASGSGRTFGAQAQVRLAPVHGFYGWISYTLAWSQRRDADGAAWRPSDYDQRHVLTTLAGYELPLGFEVGARVRVATGFPRTEVVGAYLDDRRDLYQPRFGTHNAIRLPTFLQLDARVGKRFELGRTHLDLSLEVQNVTNRANVEEFLYDADYTTKGAITGLPILPVLGVRWSF